MLRRALLLALAGCANIEFAEPSGGFAGDGGAAGSAQGAGGAGGDGGQGCPAGSECLDIPFGFAGPLVVLPPDQDSCRDGELAFRGGTKSRQQETFSFEPASCNCGCVPSAQDCPSATASLYGTDGCSGVGVTQRLQAGDCAPATGTDAVIVSSPGGAMYGCVSDGQPPTLSPVVFNAPVTTCLLSGPPCGEGSQCISSAQVACVSSDAPRDCPAGFPERLEIMREKTLVDTRDCSCSCGGSGPCGSAFEAFEDDACTQTVPLSSLFSCATPQDPGQSIQALRYLPFATAQCSDPGEVASGTVISGEVGALCCQAAGG